LRDEVKYMKLQHDKQNMPMVKQVTG